MPNEATAHDLSAPPIALIDGAALFLDFDGTLVELADTPDAISVPLGLPSLLRRLSERLGGRIGIISGRAVADLENHLDCSGIGVSGSHGLELRRRDGSQVLLAGTVDLKEVTASLRRFVAGTEGLLIEEKPRSVALHYRKAPAEEQRVEDYMDRLARKFGLSLQPGKMVFELRPKGADKGDAIRAFMGEPEFAGARPLFMGDDLTDEHGFEAVREMGGSGILVGPPRSTAAAWRLDDVAAASAWLDAALEGEG